MPWRRWGTLGTLPPLLFLFLHLFSPYLPGDEQLHCPLGLRKHAPSTGVAATENSPARKAILHHAYLPVLHRREGEQNSSFCRGILGRLQMLASDLTCEEKTGRPRCVT